MNTWRHGAGLAVFLYGLCFPGPPMAAQECPVPVFLNIRSAPTSSRVLDLGAELDALKQRITELEAMTQAGLDLLAAELADQRMLLESHTQKLESIQSEHSIQMTEPKRPSIWARLFGWVIP